MEDKTIKFGNLSVMAENLSVSHFRNGDLIPEARSPEESEEAIKNRKPCFCEYKDDAPDSEEYAKFYNWYAVEDIRNIAPKGWRVLNKDDWREIHSNGVGYGGPFGFDNSYLSIS